MVKKMLCLICYVAVVFHDPKTGEAIFEVAKEDIGQILSDVPSGIQKDPMYGWLIQDGAIRVVDSKNVKQLENEPMKDVTADGKSAVAAEIGKQGRKKAEKTEGKSDESENDEDSGDQVTEEK